MLEADWSDIKSRVQRGEIATTIACLEAGLQQVPGGHFRALLGAKFSNDTLAVARELEAFRVSCERQTPVRAIYLEMNGFEINPDRWFFDYFAYDSYSANDDDLDWLGNASGGDWPPTTLLGLESVQADYVSYIAREGYRDPAARAATSYVALLIMCRFAELIQSAVEATPVRFRVPILVTAHDFDFVARFLPKPDA